MPLLVRLRPNVPFLLLFILPAIVLIVFGSTMNGLFRIGVISGGVLLLALTGMPVIASTVFRVPVIVIDAAGIRFPLMGVRLSWAQVGIGAVRRPVTAPAGVSRLGGVRHGANPPLAAWRGTHHVGSVRNLAGRVSRVFGPFARRHRCS